MSKTVGNTTGQPQDLTVATGTGAVDADTQRVVLATDQPAVPVAPHSVYLSSPSQIGVGIGAKFSPFGALSVEATATPLMSDPFDGVLDTVNRWNVSGTTLPATATGGVVASLGATNSVSSVLTSKPTFVPAGQSFMLAGQVVLGAQQTNPNAHTFFGLGSVTAYASATPLTDGFGFERDITGALNAVVYVGGVRYVANSTNPALVTSGGSWAANMIMSNYGADLTWPVSGTAIVMLRYFNGFAYFYLADAATGTDVPVALASWVPNVTVLPIRFASVTTPAVSTVLATTSKLVGFIMGVSGGTNNTVSDPVYPFRQAGVNTTVPLASDGAMSVRLTPNDIFRMSFADAYSGAVDPAMILLQTGAGMAVNQTGGNLVITSGTTANSETMIRSVRSFRGALCMRWKSILSQRIVQNNFIVELADLLGEGLAYTINSTTSVTATFLSVNPFTAANVGQFCNLGVIAGAAGIPGRYAIASVSGLTVTFTVVAWPATGSGTLTVYGWNYLRANYNGATATATGFDAQRRGWGTGDTALTTLTSASPGHIGSIQTDNAFVDYSDSLVATNTSPQWVSRGSRLENIPNDDTTLYLFIRVLNGTSAPATTTTWTVGLAQVELLSNQKVFVAGTANSAGNRSTPVTVLSGAVTATMTATTLTSVVPGVAATSLGKAEDAAAASGDTGVMALGVQRASPASNVAGGNGRYGEIILSPNNGLFVAPSPIIVATVLTPTIDTAAYAIGDRVGSVITIPAALATGRAGQLISATLVDKAKAKAALELWVFKLTPTLVNADNLAFDITDANLLTALYVGKVDFLAADYADTASSSVCTGTFKGGAVNIPYVTSASANLFGVFVSRGTPTYGSTTDLVVEVAVNQF